MFDLYVPRSSWLHRLDPRTKLWGVLLITLAALLIPHLLLLAGLLIALHLILLSAQVPVARLRWVWARMAPLTLAILLLQPFFSASFGPAARGAPLLALGPLRLTVGGILEGISFALRANVLAVVTTGLLLTTDQGRLVQGLVRLGLPYTWGLTFSLALRYLPTGYGLFVSIREAQQARGWQPEARNFLQRARAYLPVLVAVIIAALRLSDALAMALAARGFGSPRPRTVWREIRFTGRDWLAVGLVTLLFVGLMGLRFGLGVVARPW